MAGKRALRVGVFGAAIMLIVGVIVYLLTPREPRYQGRSLSQWLKAFDECTIPPQPAGSPPITTPTPEMEAIEVKIKAIGSNAIPTLLKWLQAKDSPTKIKINALLDRQNFIHFRFQSVWKKNVDAQEAFFILRHEAYAAAPKLIRLTRSSEPKLRERALECLSCIEPEKNVMLPVLLPLLKDPAAEVRGFAAICMVRDYPEEIEKDPVLRDLVDQAKHSTLWSSRFEPLPRIKTK